MATCSTDSKTPGNTPNETFLVECRGGLRRKLGVCHSYYDRFEIDWFDGTSVTVADLSYIATYKLPHDHEAPPDYFSPDWGSCGRVHEWKNYISSEVRALWKTFTLLQRASLARQADAMALAEDWD